VLAFLATTLVAAVVGVAVNAAREVGGLVADAVEGSAVVAAEVEHCFLILLTAETVAGVAAHSPDCYPCCQARGVGWDWRCCPHPRLGSVG